MNSVNDLELELESLLFEECGDPEFELKRKSYIRDYNKTKFPWEAAYYYYTIHANTIEILSYEEFMDNMLMLNSQYDNRDDAFINVSKPIYECLNNYFSTQFLMNADDSLVKVF